jgi:hypothetical protein
MNTIILLLSIVIKIIIVISLIALISILFIGDGSNNNIQKFTTINPTLNKCIIYKTKIEDTIKPIAKDFLNSEINIKNAALNIETAKTALNTDPNYNANLQKANVALTTAIYNRDCKVFGIETINIVNKKINDLMSLNTNLNVPQASGVECNYLISEIMKSLAEISTKQTELRININNLQQDWANKLHTLNITPTSSPNYSKILKDTSDAEVIFRKANEYNKCYVDNAVNIYTKVNDVLNSLYDSSNDQEEDIPTEGDASGGEVLTADDMRSKGYSGIANVMDLLKQHP